MADELKIMAKPREEKGSGCAGRLRGRGILPAVVYGEGKETKSIQLQEHEVNQLLRHHSSGNILVDLEMGKDQSQKVLLKDVQRHPLTGRLLHADFQVISMSESLRISVPVEFIGEPEGVSQQGGTLEHLLREIEVECLPTDILEKIELDVSELLVGDHRMVRDIPLDLEKYTLVTDPDVAVAGVAAPRLEEEPVEEEEVAAEGTGEPEVIGEKKEEDEGEAKAE